MSELWMDLTEKNLTYLQVAMAPTQEEATAAKSDNVQAVSPKKRARRRFQPAKSPRSPKRRKRAQRVDKPSEDDEHDDEDAVAEADS